MSGAPFRIGTRSSALALWQANKVAETLRAAGHESEIVPVRTTGDKRRDVSLSAIGGKGVFIKELEEALDAAAIDLAVHSLKDVPSIIPDRFLLAGFLERGDPRDAWIHSARLPIESLRGNAVIGSSSPRRRAQILSKYPHVQVQEIRGNVDTRLNKLRAGSYDGIVLAAAGLQRLERATEITSLLSVEEFVPAAGQGIVVIECLAANGRARAAVSMITIEESARAARCERGVLQKFGDLLDCHSAIAVHATFDGGATTLRAFASDLDGRRCIRVTEIGHDPEAVIDAVYAGLVRQGADELLPAVNR